MRRLNTLAEDWEAFSLCIYLNVIEASNVATLVYSMHIWMLNLFLLFRLVVVVALTRNTTSPFLWISISFFAIAYNFKCNGKFLKWLSSCSKVFKANRIFKLCSYFFHSHLTKNECKIHRQNDKYETILPELQNTKWKVFAAIEMMQQFHLKLDNSSILW